MTLRILDYGWHQGHSYRLHALPAEFTYAAVSNRVWTTGQRPIPANFAGIVAERDVNPADYDVAFLHLDQWCDDFDLRATPFRIMNIIAKDLPRVVIMHGTPDNLTNRERILKLIDRLPVVCNSFQAAAEWDGDDGRLDYNGLLQFRTIIHGYSVDEFHSKPLDERSGVITVCSGGHTSRRYHGIPLIERLMRDIPLTYYGPHGNADWLPNYAAYRNMLASSLIYLSPSRRAPMPGARTEAMLSGCCIVTVPGHGVHNFITNGRNGFIVRTYEEARDTLAMLLRDPGQAWEIGQIGRNTARVLFNSRRFVWNWACLLHEIGVAVPLVDFDWACDEACPDMDMLAFLGWPAIFT